MKIVPCLLFACLGLHLVEPGIVRSDDAVVAAWNVAAGRNGDAGIEIPPDRIKRIAKVIVKLKPKVIFLSEVFPLEHGVAIAKEVTSQGWEMVSAPVPAQKKDVVQLFAILHSPGVKVANARTIKGSDTAEKTSREAILADVTIDKFDFMLIGVHLKSERTPQARKLREAQCTVLAEEIKNATQGAEKDVLVVGDYNMIPKDAVGISSAFDEANFKTLNPDGYLQFISDKILGPTHVFSWSGNEPQGNHLDGFAISAKFTNEYRADSIKKLTPDKLGVEQTALMEETDKNKDVFISDHLPIIAEFDTSADDD